MKKGVFQSKWMKKQKKTFKKWIKKKNKILYPVEDQLAEIFENDRPKSME